MTLVNWRWRVKLRQHMLNEKVEALAHKAKSARVSNQFISPNRFE